MLAPAFALLLALAGAFGASPPPLGNGYVGITPGSGQVFLGGVFAGVHTANGSSTDHRAAVAAVHEVNVTNADAVLGAAALHINNGSFAQDFSFTNHSGAAARLTVLPHRARRHLVLVLVDVWAGPEEVFVLKLAPSVPSGSTDDVTLWKEDCPGSFNGTFACWSGTATAVEEDGHGGDMVGLGVAAAFSPVEIQVRAGEHLQIVIRTAYASTLDGSDAVATAAAAAAAADIGDNAALLAENEAAWADLWSAGVDVDSDGSAEGDHLQRVVRSSAFFLLSAIRHDWPHSLSPGGLTAGYDGHSFWDCETWMAPNLFVFHPDLARTIFTYRLARLAGAKAKAKSYVDMDYDGAMFPWESAVTGREVAPASTGWWEQHITGDIGLAAAQFHAAQRNETFLADTLVPLMRAIATFWASRVSQDPGGGPAFHINGVTPPDEYAVNVNDSAFTNAVAATSLRFAAANVPHENAARWREIADGLTIPRRGNIVLEYDGYPGNQIKQADVVLLGYPVEWPLNPAELAENLAYYGPRTDPNGPAMTWAMMMVGEYATGNATAGKAHFARSYANARGPFLVWDETPQGGTYNFITGAGGFLQGLWATFAGLRFQASSGAPADGIAFHPTHGPPPGTSAMHMRNMSLFGTRLSLSVSAQTVSLQCEAGSSACAVVRLADGHEKVLSAEPFVIPPAPFTVLPPRSQRIVVK